MNITNSRSHSLPLILLVAVSFIVFSPCLKLDFTNWDDTHYLTENEDIREISSQNIYKIFTSRYVAIYCPLVVTSFALEHHFFGLNPFVYHLDNLLLHILNGLLVYGVIYLLAGSRKVAFLTALLFALHPMKVENVAWISARKDLLSAPFFLLSMASYIIFCRKNAGRKFYVLSFVFYTVGLFAKPSLITLPLVLLLIDYYFKRPGIKKNIAEKIPYLIFACVFALVNALAQSGSEGAFTVGDILMVHDNFLVGTRGIAFYILKSFLPLNLCAFYPYPARISLLDPQFLFSLVFVFALLISCIKWRNNRTLIFGMGFFLVTMALVLKFIPVGDTIAADRYMYLPSIGVFFIAASFTVKLLQKSANPLFRKAIYSAIVLFCGFFAFMSYRQCPVWKNSKTLFTDVLKHYPGTFVAHLNLGLYYHKELGDPARALAHYHTALKIKKDCLDCLNNIGTIQLDRDNHPAAITYFKKVLQISPRDWAGHYNLANAYAASGNFPKAIDHFEKTIDINPVFAKSYHKLAECYQIIGENEKARQTLSEIKNKGT